MDKDKEWLFSENIRLRKWSDELEHKEKVLQEEKKNFEQQKKALEIGFKKLVADKETFMAEMKKEKAKILKSFSLEFNPFFCYSLKRRLF